MFFIRNNGDGYLSGNLGIGTSSPNRNLKIGALSGIINITAGTGNAGGALRLSNYGEYESGYGTGGATPDYLGSIEFYSGDTSTGTGVRTAIKTSVDSYYNTNSLVFYTAPSATAGIIERMRIMSDGNLQVSSNGTPDATNTNSGINVNGYYGILGLNHSGNDYSVINIHTSGGNNKFFEWRWGNSTVGNITTNGSSTSYNTSSDYRLKEDWVAVADAATRVNALKPVNFAWKADGKRVDGFLAHELAEVVPEAVTGEKDAVELIDIKDEEGNVIGQEERPVYQGIDQSKLVPLLTAALQEALAEINSLKARLDAANL